jgi:cyclopropane fatty-acyl-phospholipid synthase-like methyltransferase
MTDDRLFASATLRNRDPILDVLRATLPDRGTVLEIASGSGEHVVHFARHLPALTFQPSDPSDAALRSVAAWIAEEGLSNIEPPLQLDAAETSWPVKSAAAVICINMIHISPWRSTEGLMRGAAAILPAGGPLYLYGPYRRNGAPTAPSNEEFDRSLRSRDPAWGLRSLEDVAALAAANGFSVPDIVAMPANNLSVIFRKL